MKNFNKYFESKNNKNKKSPLKVLMLNCTLKKEGESNTESLLKRVTNW